MKIKTIIASTILYACASMAWAQLGNAPKFANKAMKAIVSLNAYDEKGELINSGTAFFVGKDGEAICDYQLLKGASKATVIDQSGKTFDVDCILGADDTYGMVRFKTNIKGNAVLSCATSPSNINDKLYALTFDKKKISVCPQGTIADTSSISGTYKYYGLDQDLGEKTVGAPVFNEKGELVGILHPASGKGNILKSYVLDIAFRNELSIKALSTKAADLALSGIKISKGLPDTLEEALVYTYFKSRTASNEEYLDMLNRFVATWPDNPEGYNRRMTPLTDMHRFDEAEADLQHYLKIAPNKPVAYYTAAQTICNKLQYIPQPDYPKWNYTQAEEYVKKSIELRGGSIAACTNAEDSVSMTTSMTLLAKIYSAQKRYDEAIAIYRELNATPLRSAAIYYAESLMLEARGDSASVCIVPIDSALAMFPTPLPREAANYILRRGQLNASREKYREAVQDFNQYAYLMNSKVSARFYYDRSQLEVKARMYQNALDDISMAITQEPREIIFYLEKASLCLRFNQVEECIRTCQTALMLDGNNVDALRILGYAQTQNGETAEGQKNLRKAADLGDENAKKLLERQ